jgi:hypothetical protein
VKKSEGEREIEREGCRDSQHHYLNILILCCPPRSLCNDVILFLNLILFCHIPSPSSCLILFLPFPRPWYFPLSSPLPSLSHSVGTSTRRLAKMFPQASRVLGVDLSPFMIAIGTFLLEEVSTSRSDFEWVDTIEEDRRIEFIYDDIANTNIESGERAMESRYSIS